ncbi:MAG: hypothetical protein WCT01_00695 [Candidatus Shapirobacteria bacterium]|jgi:hypothetical protein
MADEIGLKTEKCVSWCPLGLVARKRVLGGNGKDIVRAFPNKGLKVEVVDLSRNGVLGLATVDPAPEDASVCEMLIRSVNDVAGGSISSGGQADCKVVRQRVILSAYPLA